MTRATLRRFLLAGAALALLWLGLAMDQPALAGGPVLVGGPTLGGVPAAPGKAFVWSPASAISYRTDLGGLGSLTHDAANNLVAAAFGVWDGVSTAAIGFSNLGDMGTDVTGANQMTFFNAFINNCNPPVAPAPTDTQNVVVYDTDGSITDGILGSGQNTKVIGFAGVVCISTTGTTNRLTRGRAVLNGRFKGDLAISDSKFQQVATHEFGHLIGLDHSQANEDIIDGSTDADTLCGLPLMFPVLFSNLGSRTELGCTPLAVDDEAWVSNLYRAPSFSNTFGTIEGHVFFSDAQTPAQGTNLVARLADSLATPGINESRRFPYSSTSGYLFTGNPGQGATAAYLPCSPSGSPACTNGFFGNNEAGSTFGSRDDALIGFFQIPVKSGSYTLQVEAIDPDWTGGSRVGPLGSSDGAGEQFPLPGGTPEFWSPGESATDDPFLASVFFVGSGVVVPKDIILNNTPPRFDAFESAALWWPSPPTAWLRERRPPAFLVNG